MLINRKIINLNILSNFATFIYFNKLFQIQIGCDGDVKKHKWFLGIVFFSKHHSVSFLLPHTFPLRRRDAINLPPSRKYVSKSYSLSRSISWFYRISYSVGVNFTRP